MSLPNWADRTWEDGRTTYEKLLALPDLFAQTAMYNEALNRLQGGLYELNELDTLRTGD